MLQIIIKKSKSKQYNIAAAMIIQLGGQAHNEGLYLEIKEYELINAYANLLPLISIINKWKGVSATFRGQNVELFRFVFLIFKGVTRCAFEKNESKEPDFCQLRFDVPSWGCRLVESLLLYNEGSGIYDRSGRYWYNYGSFNDQGIWIIDKERIFAKLEKEIAAKALDVCPYFDIERIKKIVFRDLPEFIIPDNYNYRLHYEKVYTGGVEILKAVNIRHISDLSLAPGTINKRIVYELKTVNDIIKSLPPDIPWGLKSSIKRIEKEELRNGSAVNEAFDKDGICRN